MSYLLTLVVESSYKLFSTLSGVDTVSQEQNGRHLANDVFKHIHAKRVYFGLFPKFHLTIRQHWPRCRTGDYVLGVFILVLQMDKISNKVIASYLISIWMIFWWYVDPVQNVNAKVIFYVLWTTCLITHMGKFIRYCVLRYFFIVFRLSTCGHIWLISRIFMWFYVYLYRKQFVRG